MRKLDFHRVNAAIMFNVNYMDVTPDQRHAAKCGMFFNLYYTEPTCLK